MANVTTETIMRRILGRAKEAENGGVETPPHKGGGTAAHIGRQISISTI